MRADSTLMHRLPPHSRRNRLDSREIRELVENVRAGYSAPANLEKSADYWRLRITINKSTGGSVRRGFTIVDEATAMWVANYLANARERWQEECRENRRKDREQKRLDIHAQQCPAAAQG